MTDIDALYALPLDEFTQARDALAADLRASGDKPRAAEVKKLRKPSLAAWAVNQVARRDRASMTSLFELRDKIESATNAAELRAAVEERRHLIAELVKKSERTLRDAGHAAGANTVQAIMQTFHSGDTDEDRDALANGRLTRELSPTGFGGLAPAFEPSPAADEGTEDPKLEEKRRRAQELAEEADQAEAEAERLDQEVTTAERALQRAEARAQAARRSAEQARKHAERAQTEIEGRGSRST